MTTPVLQHSAITIRYWQPGARWHATMSSLILPVTTDRGGVHDWRKDVQYYRDMGYQVAAAEALCCVRCRGVGQWRVKPKGWRKRTPPPWFVCKLVECPACAGYGYVAEIILE